MDKSENRYYVLLATAERTKKIIEKLSPNKGARSDKIPPNQQICQ